MTSTVCQAVHRQHTKCAHVGTSRVGQYSHSHPNVDIGTLTCNYYFVAMSEYMYINAVC